jgi:hypothetical protein
VIPIALFLATGVYDSHCSQTELLLLSRFKLLLPSWAESAMTHLIKESDTIVKSELLFHIQNKIKTTNK